MKVTLNYTFYIFLFSFLTLGIASKAIDLTVAAGQVYQVPIGTTQEFQNGFISGEIVVEANATLNFTGNLTLLANTGAKLTIKPNAAVNVQLNTQVLQGSNVTVNGGSRAIFNIFSVNGATLTVDANSYLEVKNVTASIAASTFQIGNAALVTFRGDLNITDNTLLSVVTGGVIELYGHMKALTSARAVFDTDGELRLLGKNQIISSIPEFYNLTLGGSGTKQLSGSSVFTVKNILNLGTQILTLDDTLVISNTQPEAIDRVSGYITANRVRRLIDAQSENKIYLFPLGSNGKYHPVEIKPLGAFAGSYTVTLKNTSANNLASLTSQVKSANGQFYHQIYKNGDIINSDVTIFYENNVEGPFDYLLSWNGGISKWDLIRGGSGTLVTGTLKGITSRAVSLSQFNNSNPGPTIFVLGSANISTAPPAKSYAVLKKELDGGFYSTSQDLLRFQFEEEYASQGTLNYTIYDNNHTVVSNGNSQIKNRGFNHYELNIGALIDSKSYALLEVRNEKGEKWYLRFTRQF